MMIILLFNSVGFTDQPINGQNLNATKPMFRSDDGLHCRVRAACAELSRRADCPD